MKKEEVLKILNGPEKWEVYYEFQKLEKSTEISNFLYQYIDELIDLLNNSCDYIRLRSFRLICRLAKYDKDNYINNIINKLLDELDNEKPTVVRQCLASLKILLDFKPELYQIISSKLINFNYLKFKDSMSPLIKEDIDNILSNNI